MTTQLLPRSVLSTILTTGNSTQVAPQNLTRNGLFVFNPNSSVSVWISPGDNPAVTQGAGSIVLQPFQGITLGADFPFTQALNAITASPPAQLTIWEF